MVRDAFAVSAARSNRQEVGAIAGSQLSDSEGMQSHVKAYVVIFGVNGEPAVNDLSDGQAPVGQIMSVMLDTGSAINMITLKKAADLGLLSHMQRITHCPRLYHYWYETCSLLEHWQIPGRNGIYKVARYLDISDNPEDTLVGRDLSRSVYSFGKLHINLVSSKHPDGDQFTWNQRLVIDVVNRTGHYNFDMVIGKCHRICYKLLFHQFQQH